MSFTQEVSATTRSQPSSITITEPELPHGGDIWRLAKNSAELDLNSSYMYLLFARDFANTSRVALADGEVVGFVLAYRRSEDPRCLFVWQVAVDEEFRGQGLARRMLDDLISAPGESAPIHTVETTVTDDNIASRRLFSRLADRWGAELKTRALFDESHFPDEHDTERLHLIGPINPNALD